MAAPARSKPIAASIGTLFGGLWAFLAATAAAPSWQQPLMIVAGVTTVMLVWRLWVTRAPPSAAGGLFGRKAYLVAVLLEVVAIYAASSLLPRFGWQSYLIQAVGIIVGLHFIGLWIATKSISFVVICVGMCAVSAIAILLPEILNAFHLRDCFTGEGNALVLWLGAGRAEGDRPG